MAAKKSKTQSGFHQLQWAGTPSDPASANRTPFYGIVCPPEGDLKTAYLMLIGEAPGENEINNRDRGKLNPRPFIDSSGKVLDRIIKGIGIPRSLCYLTNVVKERPHNNNISIFIDIENEVGSLAWFQYIEQLRSEIDNFNGSTIVALGTTAMYATTGLKDKITLRRGSIYPCILNPSKKVVVMVHPRYCLTQYLYEHISRLDLFKALQERRNNLPAETPRTLFINPTYENVIQYLTFLKSQKIVSLDIELIKQEISHISFSHDADYAMSIPFYKAGQNYFTLEQEDHIWKMIGEILLAHNVTKMLQNGSFDWSFIFKKYGLVMNNFTIDTMVMQGITYPDLPKSLGFICSTRTRIPYYKDEGKGDSKNWNSVLDGDDRFQQYNAKDSISLHEAYPPLYYDLQQRNNLEVYSRTMTMIEPLIFMMERGIRMDVEGLAVRSKKANEEIEALDEQIKEVTGVSNPGSRDQLKDYFYNQLRIKPYYKRAKKGEAKSKNPTLDEKTLIRINNQGYLIAGTIIERTKLATFNNRYYKCKLESDRLKCFMNVVGAIDTGRFSSSKNVVGLGNNMQNSPADYKRFQLADPGYMIFEADYKQAELICIAYIAPETSMIFDIESGIDLHTSTAKKIIKILTGVEPDVITKAERKKKGKEPNFGFNYGLSAQGFSLQYMVPLKEAKIIREAYLKSRKGIPVYWNWINKELSMNQRKITNPFGRTRVFLGRWNDIWKEGADFFPQSTVADAMSNYGIYPAYYRNDYFDTLELQNQVHDSLVFQIPLSDGWIKMAEKLINLKWFMSQPIEFRGRKFSLGVDINAGLNLADVEMDEGKTLEEVGTWAKSWKVKKMESQSVGLQKITEVAGELKLIYERALSKDERGLHHDLNIR